MPVAMVQSLNTTVKQREDSKSDTRLLFLLFFFSLISMPTIKPPLQQFTSSDCIKICLHIYAFCREGNFTIF